MRRHVSNGQSACGDKKHLQLQKNTSTCEGTDRPPGEPFPQSAAPSTWWALSTISCTPRSNCPRLNEVRRNKVRGQSRLSWWFHLVKTAGLGMYMGSRSQSARMTHDSTAVVAKHYLATRRHQRHIWTRSNAGCSCCKWHRQCSSPSVCWHSRSNVATTTHHEVMHAMLLLEPLRNTNRQHSHDLHGVGYPRRHWHLESMILRSRHRKH